MLHHFQGYPGPSRAHATRRLRSNRLSNFNTLGVANEVRPSEHNYRPQPWSTVRRCYAASLW